MLPPKHVLSKTTYLYGCQCHKRLWLHKHRPKEKDVLTEAQSAIFQRGTDVGILAQQLFPRGIDASPAQPWLYQQAVYNTEKYIRSGHQVIYEAAFQYEGILCAVDLLVKTSKGWIAYEVKSALSLKPAHIHDAALQYYVITNSGISLADMVVVHLNRNYTRQGELDLRKLFKPITVLPEVVSQQEQIAGNTKGLLDIATQKNQPDIETGDHCFTPYVCDFLGLCHTHDLFSTAVEPAQPDEKYLDQLRKISPLHFLYLQSWRAAVPLKDGQWPYRENIFQFSLLSGDSTGTYLPSQCCLENKMEDPRCLITELLAHLPAVGNIITPNQKSVHYQLEALKKENPDLGESITGMQKRLIDLSPAFPFQPDQLSHYLQQNLKEKYGKEISVHDAHQSSAAFYNMDRDTTEAEKIKFLEAIKNYGHLFTQEMYELVKGK